MNVWRGRRGIGAVLALCAFGALPTSAACAATPGNDNFAEREDLSGALPIEVSRSNVGATKESGEFLGSIIAAGHSVWFSWEATSDGWVTIGGCQADFVDVVRVYTGTAVDSLTPVATSNGSEGPHCPFEQREYTFWGTSGTEYEIVVDGDPFHLPESPPPDTEGSFDLHLEATPVPANDDFGDAAALVTHFEEEWDGEAFYRGSTFGYNWAATEEAGEPDHPGGSHGASVWYSWTAPVSGEARIGFCCSPGLRLSVYTGTELGTLQLLVGGFNHLSGLAVIAGETYQIAVYGAIGESVAEPATEGFQLMASVSAPVDAAGGAPPPAASAAPSRDTTPPDTWVAKRVMKRKPPIWVFSFGASEPGSSFRCKLDRHRFAACASHKLYKRLAPGRHVLRVVAVDVAGNVDPTPAVAHFRMPWRRRHRVRHRSSHRS